MLSQRMVFCLGFKNLLGFVAIGPVSDLLDAYTIVDYGGISGGRHLHTLDSIIFSNHLLTKEDCW